MANSLKPVCVYYIVLFLMLAGCDGKLKGKPVSLKPNDSRPILSLQVADVQEAELVVQQLEIEVIRTEGPTIFFFKDASKLPRLAELGYSVKRESSYDVYRRVVRIDRSISEAELVKSGIWVINREKDSLIINATIGQLKALVRGGSQIVAILGHEPRPRQIRIVVDSKQDVAKIGAMQIDIYSAKPQQRKPIETPRKDRKVPIVIHGAAFDYQIDQLKENNYSIEILPDPVHKNRKGSNHEKME